MAAPSAGYSLDVASTATSGNRSGDYFGGTINGPGASSSGGKGGMLGDLTMQILIGVAVALAVGFILKRK